MGEGKGGVQNSLLYFRTTTHCVKHENENDDDLYIRGGPTVGGEGLVHDDEIRIKTSIRS